jgi:hypothetical protein
VRLRRAVARFRPALVSEHLSWSSVDGLFSNDLLPLPYTEEALRHVSARISIVQDFLGRRILIENVSSYLEYRCSRITEWDFLAAVAAESGCGILLDINNIYVAAHNHGFDSMRYLEAIPRSAVEELHLAGHTPVQIDGRALLIDTHNGPVSEPVWALYREALLRFGPVPTLIEWDAEIPALAIAGRGSRQGQRACNGAYMPTLPELQRDSCARCRTDRMRRCTPKSSRARLRPMQRLAIYANNAETNFIESLRLSFPAVLRLVGDAYFTQCAREFRTRHPSRSGDLQHIGAAFPEYWAMRHRQRYLSVSWRHCQTRVALPGGADRRGRRAVRPRASRGDRERGLRATAIFACIRPRVCSPRNIRCSRFGRPTSAAPRNPRSST